MMYKTTVDEWERWGNPYQMMYETIVEDETGEGLPISDDVHNIWW